MDDLFGGDDEQVRKKRHTNFLHTDGKLKSPLYDHEEKAFWGIRSIPRLKNVQEDGEQFLKQGSFKGYTPRLDMSYLLTDIMEEIFDPKMRFTSDKISLHHTFKMCQNILDNVKEMGDIPANKSLLDLLNNNVLNNLFVLDYQLSMILIDETVQNRKDSPFNSEKYNLGNISYNVYQITPLWKAIRLKRVWIFYSDEKKIIQCVSQNHLLELSDVVGNRANSYISTLYDNPMKNLPECELLTEFYRIGDSILATKGNKGYDCIKLFEPILQGLTVELSNHPVVNEMSESLYNNMLKELSLLLNTPEEQSLYEAFRDLCKSIEDPNISLELSGCFRHFGHPNVDARAGFSKKWKSASINKVIDHNKVKYCCGVGKYHFIKTYKSKHGVFPPLNLSNVKNRFILDSLHKRSLPDKTDKRFNFEDFNSVRFEKIKSLPSNLDSHDVISDKACSMTMPKVLESIPGSLGPIDERKVLLKYLKEHPQDIPAFIQSYDKPGLKEEDLICVLFPKERELSIYPRVFTTTTFIHRLILALSESMAAKIVPYINGVTMKDSLAALEKRIDLATGVDNTKGKKKLLIKFNIDFSSWNWHMRQDMTRYVSEFLNDLYGLDYFFFQADDILSQSWFLLSTLEEDSYVDGKGNPKENESFKKGRATASEGLRQKVWTFWTVWFLMGALEELDLDYSLMGQGDNQIVTFSFPYNGTEKKIPDDFYRQCMKKVNIAIDRITVFFKSVDMTIKKTESWVSDSIHMYGKETFRKGAMMTLFLKRISTLRFANNDSLFTTTSCMSTLAGSASSSAKYESIPDISYRLFVLRAYQCLELFVSRNPVHGESLFKMLKGKRCPNFIKNSSIPNAWNEIKNFRGVEEYKENLIKCMIIVGASLSKIPSCSPFTLMVRSLPDPLTNQIEFIKRYVKALKDKAPRLKQMLLNYLTPYFSLKIDPELLMQDPYSINDISCTREDNVITRCMVDYLQSIKDTIKDTFLVACLNYEKHQEKQVIAFLGSSNPDAPLFTQQIYDLLPSSFAKKDVKRFIKTGAIMQSRQKYATDNSMELSLMIAEEDLWIMEIMKALLGDRSKIIELNNQSTTKYAHWLREKSFKKTLIGPTAPCSTSHLEIREPSDQTETTNGFISFSISDKANNIKEMFKRPGPYHTYRGSWTSTKGVSFTTSSELADDMVMNSLEVIKNIGWAIDQDSSLAELILELSNLWLNDDLNLVQEIINSITGRIEHRLKDINEKRGGRLNSLPQFSQYFLFTSNSIKSSKRGAEDNNLVFPPSYLWIMWKALMKLNVSVTPGIYYAAVIKDTDDIFELPKIPPEIVNTQPPPAVLFDQNMLSRIDLSDLLSLSRPLLHLTNLNYDFSVPDEVMFGIILDTISKENKNLDPSIFMSKGSSDTVFDRPLLKKFHAGKFVVAYIVTQLSSKGIGYWNEKIRTEEWKLTLESNRLDQVKVWMLSQLESLDCNFLMPILDAQESWKQMSEYSNYYPHSFPPTHSHQELQVKRWMANIINNHFEIITNVFKNSPWLIFVTMKTAVFSDLPKLINTMSWITMNASDKELRIVHSFLSIYDKWMVGTTDVKIEGWEDLLSYNMSKVDVYSKEIINHFLNSKLRFALSNKNPSEIARDLPDYEPPARILRLKNKIDNSHLRVPIISTQSLIIRDKEITQDELIMVGYIWALKQVVLVSTASYKILSLVNLSSCPGVILCLADGSGGFSSLMYQLFNNAIILFNSQMHGEYVSQQAIFDMVPGRLSLLSPKPIFLSKWQKELIEESNICEIIINSNPKKAEIAIYFDADEDAINQNIRLLIKIMSYKFPFAICVVWKIFANSTNINTLEEILNRSELKLIKPVLSNPYSSEFYITGKICQLSFKTTIKDIIGNNWFPYVLNKSLHHSAQDIKEEADRISFQLMQLSEEKAGQVLLDELGVTEKLTVNELYVKFINRYSYMRFKRIIRTNKTRFLDAEDYLKIGLILHLIQSFQKDFKNWWFSIEKIFHQHIYMFEDNRKLKVIMTSNINMFHHANIAQTLIRSNILINFYSLSTFSLSDRFIKSIAPGLLKLHSMIEDPNPVLNLEVSSLIARFFDNMGLTIQFHSSIIMNTRRSPTYYETLKMMEKYDLNKQNVVMWYLTGKDSKEAIDDLHSLLEKIGESYAKDPENYQQWRNQQVNVVKLMEEKLISVFIPIFGIYQNGKWKGKNHNTLKFGLLADENDNETIITSSLQFYNLIPRKRPAKDLTISYEIINGKSDFSYKSRFNSLLQMKDLGINDNLYKSLKKHSGITMVELDFLDESWLHGSTIEITYMEVSFDVHKKVILEKPRTLIIADKGKAGNNITMNCIPPTMIMLGLSSLKGQIIYSKESTLFSTSPLSACDFTLACKSKLNIDFSYAKEVFGGRGGLTMLFENNEIVENDPRLILIPKDAEHEKNNDDLKILNPPWKGRQHHEYLWKNSILVFPNEESDFNFWTTEDEKMQAMKIYRT